MALIVMTLLDIILIYLLRIDKNKVSFVVGWCCGMGYYAGIRLYRKWQESHVLNTTPNKPVVIPDSILDKPIVNCVIETPQFKNGDSYKMKRQAGRFYRSNMTFIPDCSSLNGHIVYFQSMEDFGRSLIRIL